MYTFVLSTSATEICCSATCIMSSCHRNGTTNCLCTCDKNGYAHCGGLDDPSSSYTDCLDATQMANINGAILLYNSFGSLAGLQSAAIAQQILTLFTDNNNCLADNTPGGNVSVYASLRAGLEAIQLSDVERNIYNQFLANCVYGAACTPR